MMDILSSVNLTVKCFRNVHLVWHTAGMATSPTINRRRLAAELLKDRLAAGKTPKDVKAEIGLDPGRLSKFERAKVEIPARDIAALEAIYEQSAQRVRELIEIQRLAKQPGWFQQYGVAAGTFVDFESGASTERIWAPTIVPGLLQTAAYARALFKSIRPQLTDDETNREVQVRMERARILERDDGPAVTAIVGEAALRTPVGGTKVLVEQLDQILEVVDRCRNRLTFQYLPHSVGAHAGMEGSLMILDYTDGYPSVGHAEYCMGAAWLEAEEEIQRCNMTFERVQLAAVPPDESVQRVIQIRDEVSDGGSQ
jgi:transcriptional regulator with XRE-family HTH domain